ncbi:autoimmune regulator isoform X1 [Cynoglossus semilaevis]|uniref:autoimmune regulator isoform X1 n=1 Tax=Cynoglossus semilaevis TaxID=244447 RepID=UPI000D62B2C8|nr:autoimmune regulator-like isoform X1 [Cynoglossus semilaevis]XP_024920517.1 autoimmune regulator-like isoform X1 [Cynoglossus semilaevis]
MDLLNVMEPTELLQFLHYHKTELSCIEKPHTLLCQLKDHNLIPEDRYKKLTNMRSKDKIINSLYDLLDWFEREQSEHIHLFWKCLFKDVMMNRYPSLKMLHQSLMDGSYGSDTQIPPPVGKKETSDRKRNVSSDDEEEDEEEVISPKKKKKQQENGSTCDKNEQQPGPSSQSTPGQKRRSNRVSFSSPLKKGEKKDISSGALFKSQLPVTCGSQSGILSKERLAKGEKCIKVDRKWFTPSEFEKFAGKERSKNWKTSILYRGTPLAKLFQEGHLKSPNYRRRKRTQSMAVRKSLLPGSTLTVSETEEKDEEEGQDDDDDDVETQGNNSCGNQTSSAGVSAGFIPVPCHHCVAAKGGESDKQVEQSAEGCQVFTVTCEGLTGTLHQQRFASGSCDKCIRTEKTWLSPLEFTKEATCQTDISWKKDIKCEGEPLHALIEKGILKIHPLLCQCRLCSSDQKDLENQKNDDECCVCRKDGDLMVMCDNCPRSFHQQCHLPHVEDATVKERRKWMCTFCIANQDWLQHPERGMDAAMSLSVSYHMLECQCFLLCLLTAEEMRAPALNPSPDPQLDRDNHIRESLDIVADKLEKKKYQWVGDILDDIRLTFTNSASENQDNPEFIAWLKQLKDLVNIKFKAVFRINDESVDCFEQN